MTTQVDFSSVFDIVLPNVYIKKISLLPSNLVDRTSASYYDEDIEYNYEKNVFGKTKVGNKPINFSQVAPGEKYLMVRAELVIKDHVRKDGKPYWVGNDELLGLMKLRVLLSRKEKVTEKLADRGLTPHLLKLAKRKGGIQEQVISLSRNNIMSIEDFKQETIDGRKVYCVSYNVSFKLPKLRPNHLAIFANTMVDLNAYALTKSKYAHSKRGHLQGNIAGQLILSRGSTVDESTMFVLPNGKVWGGPVHEHEGSYMAGAFHTSVRHSPLKEKKVPNAVVEDHRLLALAARSSLLLRPKRHKLPRGKRNTPLKKLIKHAYISDPEYSSNGKNELFMTFHINFMKLLKEKTQFGAFIDTADPKAKQRVSELSAIKGIRIYRNRVLRGLTRADYKLAEYDDRTEMVAHSAETTPGKVKTRRNMRQKTPNIVDSEKVLIGSIREVDLGFTKNLGIRSFAVSDFDMAKKTDGEFNYTVELDITDGTQKFVEEELRKLMQARNLLIEYLGIASVEGHMDMSSGKFSQMFIDKMRSTYDIPREEEVLGASRKERLQVARRSLANLPWNRSIAAYTDVLGNLTDFSLNDSVKLSEILYSFVNPLTGNPEGIRTALLLMENLESKITSRLGKKSLSTAEMDFKTRTAAYKGKMPKDIFSYKKTFRKLHDSNILNNVGYNFLGAPGKHKNAGHRAVTTEKMKERFGKEHSKYFGGPADEVLGRNYYSYLSPAAVELGSFYRLRLLGRGNNLWRPKQYNSFTTNRLAMNPRSDSSPKKLNKSSPREPEYDLSPPIDYGSGYKFQNPGTGVSRETYSTANANNSVLSKAGISVMTPSAFEKERKAGLLLDGEDESQDGIFAKELLGESTKFATAPITKEEIDMLPTEDEQNVDLADAANVFIGAITTPEPVFLEGENKKESAFQISAFVESRLNRRKNPEKAKQRFFGRMPNQVRSIFMSEENDILVNWFGVAGISGKDLLRSPPYAGMLYLNFQHINRIEVLIGFIKDRRGEAQVSHPIYRVMNKQRLDYVDNRSTPILCKMTSYENKLLRFKKSRKLTMPEYDSSFFIVPKNSNSLPPPLPQQPPADEFLSGLLEGVKLNEVGTRSLRKEVQKILKMDDISAEFQTTLPVFQPNIVSRVGTHFGTGTPRRKRVADSSMVTAMKTKDIY